MHSYVVNAIIKHKTSLTHFHGNGNASSGDDVNSNGNGYYGDDGSHDGGNVTTLY